MKENKLEAFIVIIMSLLIVSLIIFTIFKVASSTNTLRSNEPILDKSTNNEIANNNSSNNINIYNENTTLENPKEEILLSSFSTNIYDNDTNRVENIALAIKNINEKIINPGDIFSFNETVGPMDYEHGFKESTAFDSEGNKIKVPGGGMCQISSTMYNTALEANLEIVERHPHSRRVEYVPVDRDATIYYNTLDFKFKNNTENPIKIVASSDEYNVTVTFYTLKK